MSRELVVTNSEMTAAALRGAGIASGPDDVVLAWQDMLFEGPVPHTTDLPELSRIRADHLTARGWATGRGLHAEFRARDALIADHAAFDRVTLWFEHDLHDLLQLLQVLDYFAGEGRERDTLRIVHTDRHLTRFPAEALRALAADAGPVGTARINQATEAWARWREPDPRPWCALANRPRLGIKHLWHAVIASTGHVPAVGNGLTVPQRFVLSTIANEPQTARQLFADFTHWSDRTGGAYMLDWSFYGTLDEMTGAHEPLIARTGSEGGGSNGVARRSQRNAPLAITDFGRAVLAGRADHASRNTIDVWLGGTHITNETLWRRDLHAHRLLPETRTAA